MNPYVLMSPVSWLSPPPLKDPAAQPLQPSPFQGQRLVRAVLPVPGMHPAMPYGMVPAAGTPVRAAFWSRLWDDLGQSLEDFMGQCFEYKKFKDRKRRQIIDMIHPSNLMRLG